MYLRQVQGGHIFFKLIFCQNVWFQTNLDLNVG